MYYWLLCCGIGFVIAESPVFIEKFENSEVDPYYDYGPRAEYLRGDDQSAEDEDESLLTVSDNKGQVCTMAKLEVNIALRYKEGEITEVVDIKMPDKVVANGTCTKQTEDETQMNLIWGNLSLCLIFSRNETSWSLLQVLLTVSKPGELFSKAVQGGQSDVILTSVSSGVFMEAPIGYAYRCNADQTVELLSADPYEATIIFDDLHLQPFVVSPPEFGPDITCPQDFVTKGRHRDETVPIAVGSTLAIVTVATIIGYAVYRHFKVRDVLYGTME